jgi:predicted dithiol-disulfide oxidoreductase (DUF899 family)
MITIDQIQSLENEIREKKKQLADLRKQQGGEPVNDYTFTSSSGNKKLSELFGDKDELILIYNMGKSCPYCTLWADGYNGLGEHLKNRAAFAVVSPDEPSVQDEFSASRNWNFPLYSHNGTSFIGDMKMVSEKGSPTPGVSVFTKKSDGTILHYSNTGFGPGDNFCVMWDFIDMLPKGVNGWVPKYKY